MAITYKAHTKDGRSACQPGRARSASSHNSHRCPRSGALESSEASFPTFQSFLGYALIALTHGSRFFYGLFRGTRELAAPWWAYILLAVGDVESNFLMVRLAVHLP